MSETIRLSFGGASAEISLHGAELLSYVDADGREYIWQGDPAVWDQHAPILFPVCGKAKDDCVLIDGKAYPMPKHGFACNADFRVYALHDHCADLVLEADEQTRTMFPFDFALHVIYRINSHSITTEFAVENHSDTVMPFCIGGHPGLNFPFSDKAGQQPVLVFSAPVTNQLDIVIAGGYIQGKEEFSDLEDGRIIHLTHQMIEKRDTLLFSDVAAESVYLMTPDRSLMLRMDIADFPNLAIWTMSGKYADYVCLEPWQGLPASPDESGVLAEKPGSICLPAGETWRAAFTVSKV